MAAENQFPAVETELQHAGRPSGSEAEGIHGGNSVKKQEAMAWLQEVAAQFPDLVEKSTNIQHDPAASTAVVTRLAEIWRQGQVTPSDTRLDQIGVWLAGFGIFGLTLLSLVGVSEVLRPPISAFGLIALIAGLGVGGLLTLAGFVCNRMAHRWASKLQSLASKAAALLDISDSACSADTLLSNLYGQEGGRAGRTIQVRPLVAPLTQLLELSLTRIIAEGGIAARAQVVHHLERAIERDGEPQLTLLLIQAVERARDTTPAVLKAMKQVAKKSRHAQIRSAGEQCVRVLEQAIRELNENNRLLRPTHNPEPETGTLLRPAQYAADSDPELLLRPTQN